MSSQEQDKNDIKEVVLVGEMTTQNDQKELENKETVDAVSKSEQNEQDIDIEDNDINVQQTEILQQSQIFQKFLKWCLDNGLKVHPGLKAPVAFGNLGVPGVAANTRIEANTVIAAVPNKLMITLRKVKESELGYIFEEEANAKIFNEDQSGDAEFNIIAAFLIFEKLKGEGSFYKPYFDSVPESYTMYDWKKEEVEKTECAELIDEFTHYMEDIEVTWRTMRICLSKYPKHFKKEDLTKGLILWSYEFLMTRIFGYSLPCTCLVPFGDLFNHGNNSATHYIVNKLFEENEEMEHKRYKIKKHKIDLAVLDQENGVMNESNEEKKMVEKDILKEDITGISKDEEGNYGDAEDEEEEKHVDGDINDDGKLESEQLLIKDNKTTCKSDRGNYKFKSRRLKEVKRKYDKLTDNKVLNLPCLDNVEFLEDNILREAFYAVKQQEMEEQTNKNIWEINFFTTSLTEDNDTDEDQTKARKREYNALLNSELQEIQKIRQAKADEKVDRETVADKRARIFQPMDIANSKQENQYDNNDQENGCSSQISEQSLLTQQLKIHEIEEEPGNKSDGSTLSDDSNWSWYETEDKNAYFAVTTEQPVEAGKQIFLCYGRRTNKFLLQWYGFAYKDNIFDSFGFRMWIKPEKIDMTNPNLEEDIICKRFISEEDWNKKFIIHNGKKVSTSELSKEFRLKRGTLCEELVVFIRIYLSSYSSTSDVLFTLPRDILFEIEVFEFIQRLFQYMLSKYSSSIEEDELLLKDKSISSRLRFAVIIRRDHKKILQEHLNIVSQVLTILCHILEFNNKRMLEKSEGQHQQYVLPNDFKEFYMKNFEGFSSKTEQLKQRHKIKTYLQHLNLGFEREKI